MLVDVPTVGYNPFLQCSFLIHPLSHGVSFTELVLELLLFYRRCRDHIPLEFKERLDSSDVDRPLIRPMLEELFLPGTIWLLLAVSLHYPEELCQKNFEFFPVQGLNLVAIITPIHLLCYIYVPAVVYVLVAECCWL